MNFRGAEIPEDVLTLQALVRHQREQLAERDAHIAQRDGTIERLLAYLDNHWSGLERYCDDGRYGMDTNRVENTIRPFYVGRRNWLFSETDTYRSLLLKLARYSRALTPGSSGR